MKKFSCLLMILAIAAQPASARNWVERSDENARLVLDSMAEFGPEGAASLGVDGLDEEISDLKPKLYERGKKASQDLLRKLEKRLAKDTDAFVIQDLEILIKATRDNQRTNDLQHNTLLPYYNITRNVFQGVRALIDPQVPAERYPAAVVRLRKYAGLERGYTHVTKLAMDRSSERFKIKGLIGPYRGEIEQDLKRSNTFIEGMEELLANSGVSNWEEPYNTLKEQLQEYNDWLRKEMLPRARDDFRQPAALYEDALRNWGVDESP